MRHFGIEKDRAGKTPPEWLKLGAQVGQLVGTLSGRDDVVAYVGEGAGQIAPACWWQNIAEIELNRTIAFGEGTTPEMVGDLNTREEQDRWPTVTGMLLHEAMHARHTRMDILKMKVTEEDYRIGKVAEILEEIRIEFKGVLRYPDMREYLRSSALKVALDELKEEHDEQVASSVMQTLQTATLSVGRVDAGVLDPSDVIRIYPIIEGVFGKDVLDKMRVIWSEMMRRVHDSSHEDLHKYAGQIIDLLIDEEKIPKEPEKQGAGEGEGGTVVVVSPETLGDLLDALAEDAADAEMSAGESIADARQAEEWEAESKRRASSAREESENREKAREMFARSTGPGTHERTSSVMRETRAPLPEERRAAVRIARDLEQARYRDRVITETSSQLPPGRLQTRTMVQGAVERRRGQMSTVEPWRGKRRRHVEDPNLALGVLVDISGSMDSGMQTMATTAWVLSEAGRRVQAKTAMVYYGDSVFPVLKPGQHLDQVHVYTAPDGTEEFMPAFKAIDGGLNLLYGSGARLLIIASDMHYRSDQTRHAHNVIKRLTTAGVGVVIYTVTGRSYMAGNYVEDGAEVIDRVMGPNEFATFVGQAARRALERAGQRQNS